MTPSLLVSQEGMAGKLGLADTVTPGNPAPLARGVSRQVLTGAGGGCEDAFTRKIRKGRWTDPSDFQSVTPALPPLGNSRELWLLRDDRGMSQPVLVWNGAIPSLPAPEA